MTAVKTRTRARWTWGGAGLVLAGVLLVLGGLPYAVGASPGQGVSAWQLLCWPLGGVCLLIAAILLAGARGDHDGFVGGAARPRIALIVSGGAPLLLTIVVALAWSAMSLTQLLLAVVQLLTAGASAVVAGSSLRSDARAGAARWAFVAIVMIDVVGLALVVVPQGLPAFQFTVALVRPLAVVVAGVLVTSRRTHDRRDIRERSSGARRSG